MPGTMTRWEFTRRFRRGALGWELPPALLRVRQAVSEINRVARRDPILAAEGAVLFLERVSPALEHVDGSSGAIGTAVNRAVAELATVIAEAPADTRTREMWLPRPPGGRAGGRRDGAPARRAAVTAEAPADTRTREMWLERLWEAHAHDEIPYIERLGDFWGELCVYSEIASAWADRLVPIVEMAWSPDPKRRGFFHGTTACLSALLRAKRYDALLALLAKDPRPRWVYRQWGARALAALGRVDEAVHCMEALRGFDDNA